MLDIIKDKEQLTGVEKVFYRDQNNARKCSLSEEIDEEWVNEQLAIIQQREEEHDCAGGESSEEEQDVVNADDVNQELDISITRSGLIRIATEDKGTQT